MRHRNSVSVRNSGDKKSYKSHTKIMKNQIRNHSNHTHDSPANTGDSWSILLMNLNHSNWLLMNNCPSTLLILIFLNFLLIRLDQIIQWMPVSFGSGRTVGMPFSCSQMTVTVFKTPGLHTIRSKANHKLRFATSWNATWLSDALQ